MSQPKGERPAGWALAPFLAELTSRLDSLDATALRRALLSHAATLAPRDRGPFLAIFVADSAAHVPEPGLMDEIDAFAEAVEAGTWGGWDDSWGGWQEPNWRHDDDGDWAVELECLLAGLGRVFLAGDLDTAAKGYGRLLRTLSDAESEGLLPPLHTGPEFDWVEVGARWLRSLYETSPAERRARALIEAIEGAHWVLPTLSLQAVIDARPGQAADLEEFLDAWIAELGSRADSEPWALDLLVEATMRRSGLAGLGLLAHRQASTQAAVWLAWVETAITIGENRVAAEAAREGLDMLANGSERARIAEHLARLVGPEDHDERLRALIQAWRSAPTRARLLAVAATARWAGRWDEMIHVLVDGLHDESAVTPSALLVAAVLVLAGRVDDAARLAPAGGDWTGRGHAGALVVPTLLAVGADAPAASEWSRTVLAGLFADLDAGPDRDDWSAHPTADKVAFAPETVTLAGLLDAGIADAQTTGADRSRWLAEGTAAVADRIAVVVFNKHRKLYRHAARLAVAGAEAVSIASGPKAGADAIAAASVRFPRHVAYREELARAQRESPLLPAPTSRR